jgi:proton glutamate symport protein
VRLSTKIFVALLAGVLVGAVARVSGPGPLLRVLVAVEPFGTVFIRLITMVVVPLVVASLFVGVASIGDVRRLGDIGGKTLIYFLATTLIAATIGLAVARLARVGADLDPEARDALTRSNPPSGPAESGAAPTPKTPGFGQLLVDMTPQNPFASAAQADLLPLIIAVCIFGAAATAIKGDGPRTVITFFSGVKDLSMIVIDWLMRLAPAAVFILIATVVDRAGADVLRSLLRYGSVVLAALAIHTGLVLVPLIRVGARLGVLSFFRSTADAIMLAFSTASSSAALPVSMTAARRLGVSDEVASFVLPSGTTLNKNGAAVYKAVTAVFIAELYGVPPGPGQAMTIVLTSTMAAFAGAGVPGSSLVTTLIVLNAIGLGPHAAAGIALVAGVDRPLDMCRTAVNTLGNLVGAAVITRSSGEAVVPAHR